MRAGVAQEIREAEEIDDNFTVEDAAVAFATRAGGARETDERAGVAREAEEIADNSEENAAVLEKLEKNGAFATLVEKRLE